MNPQAFQLGKDFHAHTQDPAKEAQWLGRRISRAPPDPNSASPMPPSATRSDDADDEEEGQEEPGDTSIPLAPYNAKPSSDTAVSASSAAGKQSSQTGEMRVPGLNHREPRENPEFLRICVLEMAMRRAGKVEWPSLGGAAAAGSTRKIEDGAGDEELQANHPGGGQGEEKRNMVLALAGLLAREGGRRGVCLPPRSDGSLITLACPDAIGDAEKAVRGRNVPRRWVGVSA